MKPILKYQKVLPPDTVQYIGYAKDEQERLLRLGGHQVSLLEKYNCTEQGLSLIHISEPTRRS